MSASSSDTPNAFPLREVTKKLEHNFGIAHTTIQVEVGGCEPNDMFCIMKVAGHAAGKDDDHSLDASDDHV
jgi:hypothetical protein